MSPSFRSTAYKEMPKTKVLSEEIKPFSFDVLMVRLSPKHSTIRSQRMRGPHISRSLRKVKLFDLTDFQIIKQLPHTTSSLMWRITAWIWRKRLWLTIVNASWNRAISKLENLDKVWCHRSRLSQFPPKRPDLTTTSMRQEKPWEWQVGPWARIKRVTKQWLAKVSRCEIRRCLLKQNTGL